MTFVRTTEPSVEPITLSEAKANLRIDHDSEDALIEALICAAREEVEASAGLALIDQDWRRVLDCLPASGRLLLHRHPVKAITSITLYGSEGEASLLDPSDYQLDALSRPARVHILKQPLQFRAMNGVEVDFSAGFGESGADVPDLIKRAMHVLVAHWFEFRASFGAADQPVSFPDAYQRLIGPYRMRRL